jgi:hypothetical protein
MRFRGILYVGTLICVAGALAACAHQPPASGGDLPGFFYGLLHGFTIVFSLIGSILMDIRIYEFPNSGGGYDFGFVIGAASFLGGSAGGAASSH